MVVYDRISSSEPCTKVNECHPWCLQLQGQHHRIVLVFVQWAAELTCPLTLPFAHCCQNVDLGLNCFAPNVVLWNGIKGYHYAQMSLCNNRYGKEICCQSID